MLFVFGWENQPPFTLPGWFTRWHLAEAASTNGAVEEVVAASFSGKRCPKRFQNLSKKGHAETQQTSMWSSLFFV